MENIIIVFHAFPQKPCVDGLMSAIIATSLFESSNITLVPYWRTEACFQNVKKAIETIGLDHTKVVYVDCAPDLKNETDYLASVLDRVSVDVYDHHPRKDDSPINNLLSHPNFTFTFDAEHCAAVMMYRMLTSEQHEALQIEKLLKIIQYSEYEGMNPQVAGKELADQISQDAFQKAMNNHGDDQPLLKNLKEILGLKMQLFYVLDNILAKEEQWKFLYDSSLGYQEITNKFKIESNHYIEAARNVLLGDDMCVFSAKETGEYLVLLKNMIAMLSTGKLMKNCKVGEKWCSVYVVTIDIFTFGRSLEPYVREKLKEVGASYAVLINSPTKNKKGELSYYFSLRRVDENFDARDLAKFVMEKSGSKIGGGHPWGSGATLTEKEYQIFMRIV